MSSQDVPDYDPYGDSDGEDDDGSFFDIKKLQVTTHRPGRHDARTAGRQ